MSDLITYDDKIRLKSQNVSEKYKVTAGDMNEIKSVVNTNAEEVGDTTSLTTTDKTSVVNAVNELNAPEKWVSVGTTAPTDGRRVWFKKSKNLLKLNLITTPTTYSGVTFTPNNDGTITLNGTATGTRWVDLSNIDYGSTAFNLSEVKNTIKSLTSNNYTMSAKITNGKVNINFNATNKMTSCYLYENTTYNNAILQIQFEKGPTATTYEPYVEKTINIDDEKFIGQEELVSVGVNQPDNGKRVWFAKGKNLFDISSMIGTTQAGVTLTQDTNGKFEFNGTATDTGRWRVTLPQDINYPITLYLKSQDNNGNVMLSLRNTSATQLMSIRNTLTTTISNYTPTSPVHYIEIAQIGTSASYTNYKFEVMVVKGTYNSSTIGDYEPYVKPAIYVDGVKIYEMS